MALGKKTGGRKKGVPNRVTTDFKQAITRLVNSADVESLLEAVPVERRLELLGRLAEYAFPRLARAEVVGQGGGPLRAVFKIQEESSAPASAAPSADSRPVMRLSDASSDPWDQENPR